MKRFLDIAISGAAIVLLLPLAAAIAVVLALTGEHEIFYRQTRIGRAGRPFGLLKFATMLKASPQLGTGHLTTPNDPRVLPFGRLLRRTKLNELPQVWNVLRGEMSLVGPRPLTSDVFGYYSPDVQRRIGEMRPGLTGLGSLVFNDEERIIAESDLPPKLCHRDVIAPRKGALEVWYADHCSFLLDAKLIGLTAAVIILPRSRFRDRLIHWAVPRELRSSRTAFPVPAESQLD